MSTETLRPNASGDEENLTPNPGAGEDNYENVDEETADGLATYVYSHESWLRDLYNLEDHSVGLGNITSITVHAVCQAALTNGAGQNNLKIVIKSGTGTGAPDTVDEGSEQKTVKQWRDYTEVWTTNPATTAAWTWDEIDKLQAGVSLREPYSGSLLTRCTQLWVVVTYPGPTYGGSMTPYGHGVISKVIKDSISPIGSGF